MKPNYGSEIGFSGPLHNWIATCMPVINPEIIVFTKHNFWEGDITDKKLRHIIHCCSHEPLHSVLWGMDEKEACRRLDVGRRAFIYGMDNSEEEIKEIVLGI